MLVPVAPLTISYSWHGVIYPVGCTAIPEDLAIALGIATETPDPGPENFALNFINFVTADWALEALPGIGPVNATRIYEARPKDGYKSLEAVALVPNLSSGIDWDAIEAWEPDA